MRLEGWKDELRLIAGGALVTGLFGWLSGQWLLSLLAGSFIYLGWHLYQLIRLLRLLQHGQKIARPRPLGLWRSVFEHIQHLQTSKRNRKRKLSRFLTRFRDAVNALPDAAVILGPNEIVSWCNPAAKSLLGVSWPKAANTPLTDVIPDPVIKEYLSSGDFARPLEITSPVNKAKVLSVHVTPFGQKKHQHLVVARDITRIYHLDQVRRDFVANVSHELRTPLTVISGFLETMEIASDTVEDQSRPMRLMLQQAKRMEAIINDLLSLSRLEMQSAATDTEPVEIAQLLADIVSEVRQLPEAANHEIVLDADPDVMLHGNSSELQSAISNLVVNAIRHTPRRTQIQIHWAANEAGAFCSVTDNGEGISARHIPRLTERFYRVEEGRSRQSGGTGLGLAIVKHVIDRHDGELRIDSEPGRGSTFTCSFPARRVVQWQAEPLNSLSAHPRVARTES